MVINEIHFNPPENPIREEFVELYNTDKSAADISGWRLSGAIKYSFPEGTTIPAGGFLVVAEDPLTLTSNFGITAIGPYRGQLDSEGETVYLRDLNDQIADETDYKVGFPWPVAANGDGPSIELINPLLDNSLGSSWRSSRDGPTPGEPNSVYSTNAPPNIRKVNHLPEQPTVTDPVVITALVTDPDKVAAVTLEFQVAAAGDYIPSHLPLPVENKNIDLSKSRQLNPAYISGWVSLPMLDDGLGDDLLADDNIFTVTLPPQQHRTLVRYRITVEDIPGLSARAPFLDDRSLNFAYFVYDGVPDYFGESAEALNTLPVYHLITREEDYAECFAYDNADQITQGREARFFYNWSGTIVYDGVVYDNIRYRLRGGNGRYYGQGKRSMRFRLNDGYYFQARNQLGQKYPKKWRTLTLGKGFDNRTTLTFGLNEALSLYLFNKIGVPAIDTHWAHWRVVDGTAEAPDKWNGDFQGMTFVMETYDVRFLEAHGLEKGNLYKLINQTRDWEKQQRYQAKGGITMGRDHDHVERSLDGADTASFISQHVNLDRWNRWHALVEAIRHYDYWPDANKNMVYYFEPAANRYKGKLWILPWDTDASWGPNWNRGHDLVYNSLFPAFGDGGDTNTTPELWPDYFNTVRELRDLLWQRDQIFPLIDEFADFITPFEAADASRWKDAPSDAGNYFGLGGAGAKSISSLARDMKSFAFVGGTWPGASVGPGGRAAYLDELQASNGEGASIPSTPTITYSGLLNFPANGLVFESSGFSDPQGENTFGAMEWRVAKITNPNAPGHNPEGRFKLEWQAEWESGELNTFDPSLALSSSVVYPGYTYRARLRHKDNTGRWSHWSSPIEFTPTLPDISSYLDGLIISEVMYHPSDPSNAEYAAGHTNDDDFEFIELRNIGMASLDLTDLRLTKGVDFDFLGSKITQLDPGEFVLVVSNLEAMEMRYGLGLPIAGEWDTKDKLNNGGERIKLSFGAGVPIRDFSYDDKTPWPTEPDGAGFSLVIKSENASTDPNVAANWKSSSVPFGTPGRDILSGPFAEWMAAQSQANPYSNFGSSSLSNLLAYSLGADFKANPDTALPNMIVVENEGISYPALSYRLRQEASDLTHRVEVSENLQTWQSGDALTVIVAPPFNNGDGTDTHIVRSIYPLDMKSSRFLRLHVEISPR